MPGTVRLLPIKHDLRRKWAEVFEDDATMYALATLKRPAKRTKVEALASAGKYKKGSAIVKKAEAFKTVSAFSKHLPDHDVTRHTKSDLAHTIGNTMKLLGAIVTDTASSGASAFGARQRQVELKLGRFADLKTSKRSSKNMSKKKAAKRIKYTHANISALHP